MMAKFFKYFHFNKVERNGFIVLASFVILANVAMLLFRFLQSKEEITHAVYNIGENESSEDSSEKDFIVEHSNPQYKPRNSGKSIRYFKFDPNIATASE